MAESAPQSFAHHTRWDPPFHFFVAPVFILTFIWSIAHLVRHPGLHAAGLVVFMLAATAGVAMSRVNAIKVQDRVIRLEERLRLAALLPEPLRSRIPELKIDQLIGLRFASDAEIPGLVERTLAQNLKRADIKKSIQNWRPDNWRV
jgi:hypothetical protein